jgi:hypothetical protein
MKGKTRVYHATKARARAAWPAPWSSRIARISIGSATTRVVWRQNTLVKRIGEQVSSWMRKRKNWKKRK